MHKVACTIDRVLGIVSEKTFVVSKAREYASKGPSAPMDPPGAV